MTKWILSLVKVPPINGVAVLLLVFNIALVAWVVGFRDWKEVFIACVPGGFWFYATLACTRKKTLGRAVSYLGWIAFAVALYVGAEPWNKEGRWSGILAIFIYAIWFILAMCYAAVGVILRIGASLIEKS